MSISPVRSSPRPSWRCRSSTARRARCSLLVDVFHRSVDGRRPGAQAGTSHNPGRTSRARDSVPGRDKSLQHASHHLLGVDALIGAIMTHGDDSGLILPPALPRKVVIVPITRGNYGDRAAEGAGHQVRPRGAGRARASTPATPTPGWKFAEGGAACRPAGSGRGHREVAGRARAARREKTHGHRLPAATVTSLSRGNPAGVYDRAPQFRRSPSGCHPRRAESHHGGTPGFVTPACGSADARRDQGGNAG